MPWLHIVCPCPLLPHLKELPGTEKAPLSCVGAGEQQSASHPVLEAVGNDAGLGVRVCCLEGAACQEVHWFPDNRKLRPPPHPAVLPWRRAEGAPLSEPW